MPNWCENILIIEGDNKKIKKLKKMAEKKTDKDYEVFQITNIVKPPKEMEIIEETIGEWKNYNEIRKYFNNKYGSKDLYEWYNKNIGCKWDAYNSKIIEEKNRVLGISFETPWSPPLEGIKKISKIFPELTFILEYDEPLMDFGGKYKFIDGEIIESEERPSKLNNN